MEKKATLKIANSRVFLQTLKKANSKKVLLQTLKNSELKNITYIYLSTKLTGLNKVSIPN